MEQATVKRTRQQVEREYGEEKWPAVERLIEEVLAVEPDARLARALGRVARTQWGQDDPLATRPFTVGAETVSLPPSGAFGAGQGVLVDFLSDACTEETDLVVELGSGWAWHLLTFWATGGPRDAMYVAAEYTEAGRRASSRLAGLEERLSFQALAFDYHEPRFEGLAPARHALVYTAHSLEQIPFVKPALFDAVRGLARSVTCIHFEPVGWQVEGRDRPGSSAAYAEEHDYNRNLVDAVREEANSGRVTLDVLEPDVFGINAKNSTTVIRWRAVSGKSA